MTAPARIPGFPRRAAVTTARAVLVLAATLLAQGCGGPPLDAVRGARDALQDAVAAGAERYAPDTLAAAQTAQARMDAELARQARRFILFRGYDAARRLAEDARVEAVAAKSDTDAARERLRAQLEPELPALADALPAARGLLRNAAKLRGIQLDTSGLGAEIEAIEVLVSDARAAYETGRYADAASISIEAKERLDSVQRSIQDAVDKVRGST